MLTMRPLPRDSMWGITARLIRNVPLRLTSMTRSQASSGTSQSRRRSAPCGAAALLTSTSMRPNRASASAMKRSASVARLTSPTSVRTRRPRPWSSPARLSRPFHPRRISASPSSFSFRVPPTATSVATTSAPARANATEIARPIPLARAHPVTSTILPSNSLTGKTSLLEPSLVCPNRIYSRREPFNARGRTRHGHDWRAPMAAQDERSVPSHLRPSRGPLTGIRVVELADEQAEYCGLTLAGLGADVVKVEPPGGSPTRRIGPFYQDREDRERSLFFWQYNRGKRSIVLDLRRPQDRDRFGSLIATADVLLESTPRGELDGHGLGADTLMRQYPTLIVARMSPFGDHGPWADFKGSDLVHLALGGVMMNCGYDPAPGGKYDLPPIAPQMWHAFHIAGEQLALTIIAALLFRWRTGQGQYLSCAIHEAVAKSTEVDLMTWVMRRALVLRQTCRHARENITPHPSIVHTKDGRWVMANLGTRPGETKQLVALLDASADISRALAHLDRHLGERPSSDLRTRHLGQPRERCQLRIVVAAIRRGLADAGRYAGALQREHRLVRVSGFRPATDEPIESILVQEPRPETLEAAGARPLRPF